MRFLVAIFFISLLFADCKESSPTGSTAILEIKPDSKPRIVFFGDSLTAGYGLANEDLAWPNLLVQDLAKKGYDLELTNAGLSGDTTNGGLGRLDWVLEQKPNYFVLELGANDMLRGISPSVTKQNLKLIIEKVRDSSSNCKILLIGMVSTPNMGKGFRKQFDSIYPDLAKEYSLPLVPFLLIDVFSDRSLNQKDGIHPTEKGHEILANTVKPYLLKLVENSKKVEPK